MMARRLQHCNCNNNNSIENRQMDAGPTMTHEHMIPVTSPSSTHAANGGKYESTKSCWGTTCELQLVV
jgi:hypothetical protein